MIAAVGAPDVIELTRNKRHGFCCGAGGGRMFMEEHDGQRVNVNRTDEIIATGVEAVAVACPFCNIMLTDGMKQRNVEDKIEVLDIAELVARRMPDVPVGTGAQARSRRIARLSSRVMKCWLCVLLALGSACGGNGEDAVLARAATAPKAAPSTAARARLTRRRTARARTSSSAA